LNLNFSASQDWVDPLVGGRVTGAFGSKIVTIIFGDVGGWGTGSQLDYQFGGILGYRVEPNLTLQAGYRYLFVNYRNGAATIQMVTSGALMGVTFNLR
jgi:opacity protein-like surface antigen